MRRPAHPLALLSLAASLASAPAQAEPSPPAPSAPAPAASSAPAAPAAPAASSAPAAPAPPAPPAPSSDELAAKEQFLKGTELLQAGDFEGALARFLESRAHLRSFSNTANAAVCLEKMGRVDEALDMYRELVADFSQKFSDDDRKNIAEIMARLRRQVGTLDVTANVEGTVVVDGRVRGALPLFAPLSVLAGRHRVRVLKEGHSSDDAEVEIPAGGARTVELRLRPITDVARVAVREASGQPGLEVLVDGAPTGQTPWKGVLGRGAHVVLLRGRGVGTAPTLVTIDGPEAEVSLSAAPLGPEVALRPQPASARLSIDGVDVGPGVWRGRLPRAPHAVAASEVGYLDQRLALGDGDGGERDLVLAVDRGHPRWPREPRGSFQLGLLAAGGLGTTTGASPESDCGLGCGGSAALFGGAFARVGYAFLGGWRLEAVAGAARFGRTVGRSMVSGDHGYSASDRLLSQGPLVGLGGGHAFAAGRRVSLVPRLAVAVGFFSSSDRASVDVITAIDRAPMTVAGSGVSARSNPIFLLPSLEAEADVGPVRLLAGLLIPAIVNAGPTLPLGDASVTSPGAACSPGEARCSKDTALFARPVAYRPSAFLALTVGVSKNF